MLRGFRRLFSRIPPKVPTNCEKKPKKPRPSVCNDDCQPQCPSDSLNRPPPPPCPPTPGPMCPITDEARAKLKFWENITFYGALPVFLITLCVTLYRREEEKKKPRPEYVPMEYMYIKRRPFPWGDGNHTFFHNPERNPVPPDGYEVPQKKK